MYLQSHGCRPQCYLVLVTGIFYLPFLFFLCTKTGMPRPRRHHDREYHQRSNAIHNCKVRPKNAVPSIPHCPLGDCTAKDYKTHGLDNKAAVTAPLERCAENEETEKRNETESIEIDGEWLPSVQLCLYTWIF